LKREGFFNFWRVTAVSFPGKQIMDTKQNGVTTARSERRRQYTAPAFQQLDLLEIIRSTPVGSVVDALGATQKNGLP